ncbi:protein-export chaperone SecB [Sphingosinithalassobacter sp. CS137]|uniref:protein-export chaperone SecB n=1 Tax=Sphingosinithalassobacter sp. CS137 TaxID=2762748 RepID=UPI00165DCE5F|nr:protein-export chaperone SecB [Sphingosinithalassobacter sp. CS137]
MAEPDNFADSGEPMTNGSDSAPTAGVVSQYVKDFSFENPNAPGVYQQQGQPGFDVQFNIGSNRVGEDLFEVVLKIDVRAEMEKQLAFVVDLSYAGLFAIRNFPQEQIEPFLLGEAPRILFPFARRVLADAVRDGGFPALMLEPIDFHGLYLQQKAQAQGQQPQAPTGQA